MNLLHSYNREARTQYVSVDAGKKRPATLRQQLIVLQRKSLGRVLVTKGDPLFFVQLRE
jgi:hypothetical protein